MAGGAVVAAAAAAHRKRLQRILDAFRIAGATASDRALTLERLGLQECRELDELQGLRVIVPGAGSSTWYLSEGAYVAHRDARRVHLRRGLVIAAICAIFVLGALAGILIRIAQ
jgi:hypothetical protein